MRKASHARPLVLSAIVATSVAILILVVAGHSALAQMGPFGGLRPPAAGGIGGWLIAKQAIFYRALAGLIRSAKTDGSAFWGLLGISFAYGIFHAAGPGHGKAVISSYLFANGETWRRGITLSFAAAVVQALTAVAIVGDRRHSSRSNRKAHGRHRARDRDRQLRSHRASRCPVDVGQRAWIFEGNSRAAESETKPPPASNDMITCIVTTRTMSNCHQHDHGHHDQKASITTTAMTIFTTKSPTCCRGAMRTVRSRMSWRGRAAGTAASRPSSPWVSDHARARSSFWSSRWRRGCFGRASPRPSSWGSALPSQSAQLQRWRSARKRLPSGLRASASGYGSVLVRGAEVGSGSSRARLRRPFAHRLHGKRADGRLLNKEEADMTTSTPLPRRMSPAIGKATNLLSCFVRRFACSPWWRCPHTPRIRAR